MTSTVAEELRLSDFEYHLPKALIAQEPSPVRDQSRLMVMDRKTGAIVHHIFCNLDEQLIPGDLIVLNDTKVFPCRLMARKNGGGNAEIFLISERGRNLWDALVKGGGTVGKKLHVADGIEAEIIGVGEDSLRTVRFHGVNDIRQMLSDIAETPLPPYIKREATTADRERYQTVYASHEGAVAAPTAGLHFTPELLQRLSTKGIEVATITLHVGPGTFQPVKVENIIDHRMRAERYCISHETATRINSAHAEGRRVIAVGTTSLRAIETAASRRGVITPGQGFSTLFIYPGYHFKAAHGIITNFHLPKSTLLMLVCAFAGRENILSAYRVAVAEHYRFYSYGDAMLIF
ncbi:MAG TPA: tRNA preQ1(34) S-adenosylmethionine ribosyltransferase-isomerase QueA [Nitrospirota bacterium]|nr:tRNA preQ1(34) S-adenosylmethionine ribosyltransferase-isomerase QueA [Nitrospirota bacterium]